MPGQWEGSERRSELPPEWPALRRFVLRRDGHQCRWVHEGTRCTEQATDVDHIGDKLDHHTDNLRALCSWHHGRRSSAQGNAARRGRRYSEKHPAEQHPGLMG